MNIKHTKTRIGITNIAFVSFFKLGYALISPIVNTKLLPFSKIIHVTTERQRMLF